MESLKDLFDLQTKQLQNALSISNSEEDKTILAVYNKTIDLLYGSGSEEYFSLVNSYVKNMIKEFKKAYPNVEITDVILRKKSKKSIFDKICSLYIERFGKISIMDGDLRHKLIKQGINPLKYDMLIKEYGSSVNPEIVKESGLDYSTFKELNKYYQYINGSSKYTFFQLINNRFKENLDSKDKESMKRDITYHSFVLTNLLSKMNISENDIDTVRNSLLDDSRLSKSTRQAIVRLLIGKIYTSDLSDGKKDEMISSLEKNYGKSVAQKSRNPDSDIIKQDRIDRLESNEKFDFSSEIYDDEYLSDHDRLLDESEFIRAKDIFGMQIIISEIPDDLETNNESIQRALDYRNTILHPSDDEYNTSPDAKVMYRMASQQIINEICDDFFRNHLENPEFLKSIDGKVVKMSEKHKNKTNGYIASHIKHILNVSAQPKHKNNWHTIESQLKSIYVDTISHNGGSADHSARSGKERNFPVSFLKLFDENDEPINSNISFDNFTSSQLNNSFNFFDFRLPRFYQYDPNDIDKPPHEFSFEENCLRYYNGKDLKEGSKKKELFLDFIHKILENRLIKNKNAEIEIPE